MFVSASDEHSDCLSADKSLPVFASGGHGHFLRLELFQNMRIFAELHANCATSSEFVSRNYTVCMRSAYTIPECPCGTDILGNLSVWDGL